MTDPTTRPVLALAGAGGMADAVARRLAATHTVVVGDRSLEAARAVADAAGGSSRACSLDVTDPAAVTGFAQTCAEAGPVQALLVAAGVSPVQAPPATIVAVDLVGAARVLDVFEEVLAPGASAVVVASVAGHLTGPLDPALESALAHTPTDKLAAIPGLSDETLDGNSALAYMLAKRGVRLRVQAVASAWGARGLRVNSLSPGVIDTAMGREELEGPLGADMQLLIDASPAARVGTTDEVAGAACFLLSPDAAYVTGTDLLVDGGMIGTTLLPPAPA